MKHHLLWRTKNIFRMGSTQPIEWDNSSVLQCYRNNRFGWKTPLIYALISTLLFQELSVGFVTSARLSVFQVMLIKRQEKNYCDNGFSIICPPDIKLEVYPRLVYICVSVC